MLYRDPHPRVQCTACQLPTTKYVALQQANRRFLIRHCHLSAPKGQGAGPCSGCRGGNQAASTAAATAGAAADADTAGAHKVHAQALPCNLPQGLHGPAWARCSTSVGPLHSGEQSALAVTNYFAVHATSMHLTPLCNKSGRQFSCCLCSPTPSHISN